MVAYDQTELAQALFAEIGDALFLLDPETDRLLDVNPVALQLTGFSRTELLNLPATNLFRYELPGGSQRLRGAFTKTMIFHGQDGFLLRAKGEAWVPVSLTVSRLHMAPKTLGLIIARDDRERRAALAQAQRVEAELRTVLASSPAALWSAERTPGPDVFSGWQFRYVSPLLARIAGRAPDYFDHPFKWSEVIHPLDSEAYRTALRRLLISGIDIEQLYRVEVVGGGVRWIRDRLQIVRDINGRPIRLNGCVTDVTEQWSAEEALRQSEERFRALVEKSRDGIMLLDEHGVVRYATPAVKILLGYEVDGVVGREVLAFVHADDLAEARERLLYCLAHPGEDILSVLRIVAADETIRLIEANGVNRLDDPSVRAIVVNYRDVTERELSLRERAHQHALLEGLFASVPDIVVYKDRNGLFLGGNPAFEAFVGRSVTEMIGLHCQDVFPEEWAARVRNAEVTVLATGQPTRGKEWVTYPDGRKALLDIVIAPLKSEDETPTGLIIVARDVTEHERMEEELRQSHKMDAVGRLAGGIAHDFNNLLTVVLGNLELVRSGAAAGKDADDMLAATERAAKHAADLTKQMLGFARRQPLRTTPVDLNALVRDAVSLLRRTIDPRIVICENLAADLRPVAADPVQMQQVLMNLCLNARDAMRDGGRLTIETANSDGHTDANGSPRLFARLSIADTGVGMTADVRAKVFDPFFTTKGVGEGTGLGLAVVYGAAKAHGGWVDVTSTPGSGSRFDVYVPCGHQSEQQITLVCNSSDIVKGAGEVVLVADDEVAVRELAKTALEMAGYRVLLAVDGAEAVEVFRSAKDELRLVVLDANMPRMSGRQVLEVIRQINPQVKVLFASGYHDGSLSPDSMPGMRLLNKPYIPTQLAAAVRELLTLK